MKRKHRVLWPALAIACLLLTALTFVAFGKLRGLRASEPKTTNQTNDKRTSVKRSAYVRRNSLSPKLAWHLNALGDRLEKPGRERLNLTGTLSRASDSQTQEVVAVFEFPERLRLTMQKGNETRVLSFDGGHAKKAGGSFDPVEDDLLETLVYGSAEHFFSTQMQGMATRLLGSRFLLHPGSTADYTGPFYDVYKVADMVKTPEGEREQLKLYYFNSDTLLLERVTYEINRNGSVVNVEERLSDWTSEQGQQVARRIERFENGASVFVFTVRTVRLSPRADDAVFSI
jgi:hypothetical protein